MLKFVAQSLTPCNDFCGYCRGGGEVCKEEEERERIVEISNSIDKSRISLADDVVQCDFWHAIFLKSSGVANFIATE